VRYLILSDIHGNFDALQAVLRHVRRKRFDAVINLGDLVGYGAAPNQVLDTVRQMRGDLRFVRGNHDKVVAGIEEGIGFNAVALTAARWTAERLTGPNQHFLENLRQGPAEVDGFMYCHGSPMDEDFYVFNESHALSVFHEAEFSLCFFGHTHIACCFTYGEQGIAGARLNDGHGQLQLQPGVRYFVNPGAVGQPRDRDPRAAYLIYDNERQVLQWYRTDYPISRAQRRVQKAGLPRILGDRLARGA
jgi:predicted phosphodiesterase